MPPTLKNLFAFYQQFRDSDDPIEGGERLRQALEVARGLDRPRLTAALLLKIGIFLLEVRGEIQDAMHAFVAGGRLLREDPHFEQELGTVMAGLQMRRKGYDASSESLPDRYSFDTREDLRAAEDDPLLHARLVLNAGNCYLEMGQEELALNAYQQIRSMPSVDQEPLLRAKALTNAAEVWRRRGDLLRAGPLLEEARPIFAGVVDPVGAKEFYAILAALRHRQGQPEEAITLYEQAAEGYEQADDERGYGRTLTRLGELLLDQGAVEAATAKFTRALQLSSKANDRNNEIFAQRGLARCRLASGEGAQAIPHQEACLQALESVVGTLDTEQGKLSRIDSLEWTINTLIDQYLALLDDQPGTENNAAVLLRRIDKLHGLVLDQVIGGKVEPFEKQGAEELDDWGFPAANVMVDVRQFAGGDFLPPPEKKTPHPLRTEVPPLARLVYHVTADRLVIIVDRPGQPPVVVKQAINRMAFRERVKALVVMIQKQAGRSGQRGVLIEDELPIAGVGGLEEQLAEWYRELIEPVATLLPSPGDLLLVEPHDALYLLPFSAIGPDKEHRLGDQYPLLISPSQETLATLRSYQPYQEDPAAATVLVVGNPDMPGSIKVEDKVFSGFTSLAGADREAAFIRQQFSEGEVIHLRGAAATLENIEEVISRSNIVHLATHGVADEAEPMASFLVVAGDPAFVTARHIRDWRMPADLVVLSACQTALGRLTATEGIIGLSRAFFIAGARTVVVSLWAVDDSATAQLMENFYQALLKGKNTATALWKAQQKLRSEPRYRHPAYWAGFVVIGAEGERKT